MRTLIVAMIECNEDELRVMKPFIRAASFAPYDSEIHITCGRRTLRVVCTEKGNCLGWNHFRDKWIQQHGCLSLDS